MMILLIMQMMVAVSQGLALLKAREITVLSLSKNVNLGNRDQGQVLLLEVLEEEVQALVKTKEKALEEALEKEKVLEEAARRKNLVD